MTHPTMTHPTSNHPVRRRRIGALKCAGALWAALMVAPGCAPDPGAPELGERAGGEPRPDAGVGSGAPAEGAPERLVVEYLSSMPAGPLEAALAGLGDNDLFKFATNTARIQAPPTPEDGALASVTVDFDGARLEARVTDAERGRAEIVLPTATHPEGIHAVRYEATFEGGRVLTGEEEVRVLFNVTDVAMDAAGHLWIGTFEWGLVAYDLGADPLDPSDDRAAALGGAEMLVEDLWPAGGVPRDTGEGAGRSVLRVVPEDGVGVWVGSLLRGASLRDDRGSPFDPTDDRFTDLHPGAHGDWFEPDSLEAALANSVSDIVPDGRGGVWLGTFGGLFHVDLAGTVDRPVDDLWTGFDPDGRYDVNIRRLALDDAGRVWIAGFDLMSDGAVGNTLVVLDPGGTPSEPADDAWGRFGLPEGFRDEILSLVVEPGGDRVWLGTSAGLFGLDTGGTPLDPADDAWLRVGRDQGLPDEDVGALLLRDDGRLWVGTFDLCGGQGGGLTLLDLEGCDGGCVEPVVTYTVADGLLDDDVSSVIELPGGQVAFGTFNALAAPVIASLFQAPDSEACQSPSEGAERTLGGPTMVGRDGLSVIDLGEDLADKSDDAVVNL